MHLKYRRLAALWAAMIGLFFGLAATSQASYFTTPAAQSSGTCTTTATSLAQLQTNVAGAAGGSRHCLANGTYSGTLNLSTSATSLVTVAASSSYGAIIQGGVNVNSKFIQLQGMDIQNTGASSSGDCLVIAAGLGAPGSGSGIVVQNNKIHNCMRNGVRFARPATCTAPCIPTTGYTYGVAIQNNFINDVGNTAVTADRNGSALVVLRGHSNTVQKNDMTDSPNDVIDAWGDNNKVLLNYIHDVSNAFGNHNDAVQTWHDTANPDGAMGPPLTNFVFGQNRVKNVTGADSHGIIATGTGHGTWSVYSNEFHNIGGQPISMGANYLTTTGNVSAAKIVGNTFVCSATAPNTIEFVNASTGSASNNIYRNCLGWGTTPVTVGTGAVTQTNNLSWGGDQVGGTNPLINTDPKFVNEAGGDFHLMSTSPAKNTGSNGALAANMTFDIEKENTARTQTTTTDRGADEQ